MLEAGGNAFARIANQIPVLQRRSVQLDFGLPPRAEVRLSGETDRRGCVLIALTNQLIEQQRSGIVIQSAPQSQGVGQPRRSLGGERQRVVRIPDRKSTRLNSSHLGISYAVF